MAPLRFRLIETDPPNAAEAEPRLRVVCAKARRPDETMRREKRM